MDKYKIEQETSYGTGWYDGEVYYDVVDFRSPTGKWYKVSEVDKHLAKIEGKMKRMQARIDKLEGRA